MENFINIIMNFGKNLIIGTTIASIFGYISIVILYGLDYKKGLITKQKYHKIIGLEGLKNFKKNYKAIMYIFIIEKMYNNKNF